MANCSEDRNYFKGILGFQSSEQYQKCQSGQKK